MFAAVSNAVGRVICGFIVDLRAIQFISYYTVILALNGTVAVIGSLSSSPTHLIVYIWVYAFIDGFVQVCATTMVRETVGLDAFPEAFAILLTVDSISIMLGPPLLGIIYINSFINSLNVY